MNSLTNRFAFLTAIVVLSALWLSGCSRSSETAPVESPKATNAPKPAASSGNAPLVVAGEALVVSKVPEPGQAPYTECLTAIKYKVVNVEQGSYDKPEILAIHWGMRDNKLMPAARIHVGERRRLELEPFSKHKDLERVMQADDTNDYSLTPYWVVSE
ncbi:MAG: hypothetical protein IT210_20185 [Armatimonadetes bacterium]|nr:hypothetical protein [Armatimonadota bacterium]